MEVAVLDLLVTLPHLFAVLVLVGWLVYGRRAGGSGSEGADGPGGLEVRPRSPDEPPIGGRAKRSDLARSA